jgi:hypothetical protein
MVKMLTLEWVVENYAGGDRQAVLAAVAQGLLPAPSGNGWEAGSIKASVLREAFQQVERGVLTAGGESPADAMYDGLVDRLLDDARFRARIQHANMDASEFVTVDHVLAHYGCELSDLAQAVKDGVLSNPMLSPDGNTEGWPTIVFAHHEDAFRNYMMIPLSPDGPDSDNYPDVPDEEDEEAYDRHAQQLAAHEV